MQNNRVMLLLGALLSFACVFFMTYHANGNWDFILPFRGKKLLLLLMMAYTIGISTLLFQTLTNNPILTPSILGFDSLYLLVQSILVFLFGGIGFTANLPLKLCLCCLAHSCYSVHSAKTTAISPA